MAVDENESWKDRFKTLTCDKITYSNENPIYVNGDAGEFVFSVPYNMESVSKILFFKQNKKEVIGWIKAHLSKTDEEAEKLFNNYIQYLQKDIPSEGLKTTNRLYRESLFVQDPTKNCLIDME